MPPIHKKIDPEVEARLRELRDFEDGFRRSRTNNLWRKFDYKTVTIFKRYDEDCDVTNYGWCISGGGNDTHFSQEEFDTEEEALGALADELGVGI